MIHIILRDNEVLDFDQLRLQWRDQAGIMCLGHYTIHNMNWEGFRKKSKKFETFKKLLNSIFVPI